jgi:hypothetical protein
VKSAVYAIAVRAVMSATMTQIGVTTPPAYVYYPRIRKM